MSQEIVPVPETKERLEVQKIRARFPEAILDVDTFRGDTRILVKREQLVEICYLLRDDPELQYNFFGECLGVDYLDRKPGWRFEVVYNLYSLQWEKNGVAYGTGQRIFLKVPVPEDDPYVPSVLEVYPGANFPEREIYDMFGIRFTGHPDMRRILMSDDWVGHPQRKDYPLGGERVQFPGGRFGPAVAEPPTAHAGESYVGNTGDNLGAPYERQPTRFSQVIPLKAIEEGG